MTRAVLENFGGEMPALPVDALPAANAQEARNLFAGSQDFRPLNEDLDVAACLSGAKSLYRTQRRPEGGFNSTANEGQNWLVAAVDVNYVRGQVDDDTTERTYFTRPDRSTPGAFDLYSMGTPRQLGVPPPPKVSVAVAQVRKPFLRKDAEEALSFVSEAVQNAVLECTVDPRAGVAAQRTSRYINYVPSGGVAGAATLTPRNGPQSNYRMGPTEEIAAYLPQPYRDQHATLWAVRSISDLSILFGAAVVPKLGVVIGTGSIVAVPLVCLPPSWIPDKANPATPGDYLFSKRMRDLLNPKDAAPIFSAEEVVNLTHVFVAGSRMSYRVPELLRQLDDVTREFSDLVLNTPLPSNGAPRPVEPTKPLVPQYVDNGIIGGGSSDPGG